MYVIFAVNGRTMLFEDTCIHKDLIKLSVLKAVVKYTYNINLHYNYYHVCFSSKTSICKHKFYFDMFHSSLCD